MKNLMTLAPKLAFCCRDLYDFYNKKKDVTSFPPKIPQDVTPVSQFNGQLTSRLVEKSHIHQEFVR